MSIEEGLELLLPLLFSWAWFLRRAPDGRAPLS